MKKTAFIAIVGRPNVGKSTLLNAILGEKVAIVSSKPQTTRNRITGILTKGDNQFVFLDTPGFQRPRTKLGDYMLKASSSSIGASDAAIIMADAFHSPGDIEKNISTEIKNAISFLSDNSYNEKIQVQSYFINLDTALYYFDSTQYCLGKGRKSNRFSKKFFFMHFILSLIL